MLLLAIAAAEAAARPWATSVKLSSGARRRRSALTRSRQVDHAFGQRRSDVQQSARGSGRSRTTRMAGLLVSSSLAMAMISAPVTLAQVLESASELSYERETDGQ